MSQNKRFLAALIFWLAVAVIGAGGGFALLYLSRHDPAFTYAYTFGFYRFLVRTLGVFWGMFPFSAIEILLYAFIALWLFIFVLAVIRLIRRKPAAFKKLLVRFVALLATLCMLFAVYVLGCGINYSAPTFSDMYGLSRENCSEDRLLKACTDLTDEILRLSETVVRTEQNTILPQGDWDKAAREAMGNLGSQYAALDLPYRRAKGLLFSELMSYQQISGIYSPFTVEANYNSDMPSYNIPFTMCHELSHLSGFMHEDEANFIAWLACRESSSTDFRYSGAVLGWLYCTKELASVNREAYRELYERLPREVRDEFTVNSEFWARYEGRIAEESEKMNDAYLKAHRQHEGVKTYNRVVNLIVNYLYPVD